MGRIGCKDCISTKCEGCNMLTLERMLNSGKFDCLMDEPHCVNQNAEVGVVKHGRWIEVKQADYYGLRVMQECSCCGTKENWLANYCPNCGAKMCGGADHED